MNQSAFEKICALLNGAKASYKLYEHEPCRSSEESLAVRQRLGIHGAIGAKALLCKLTFSGYDEFATLVVPGSHKLDTRALKNYLEGFKMMRFATPEEMLELAGVEYGCMPPFGPEIFPQVQSLYVASALCGFPRLAFNAAFLEKSIILETGEYFKAVKPQAVFNFSRPQ